MIGRLLRNVRAGMEKTVWAQTSSVPQPVNFSLTSSSFVDNGPMPLSFASKRISPALTWSGVPADARSLLLIAEDPDVPLPSPVFHLYIDGLPPSDATIPENALTGVRLSMGRIGRNAFFQRRWLPPAPPPGHGPHRYLFQLYALRLPPARSVPRNEAIAFIRNEGIARTYLVGIFER